MIILTSPWALQGMGQQSGALILAATFTILAFIGLNYNYNNGLA
jgi:hypothetical protein